MRSISLRETGPRPPNLRRISDSHSSLRSLAHCLHATSFPWKEAKAKPPSRGRGCPQGGGWGACKVSRAPSRPGEFHPESLTEPYESLRSVAITAASSLLRIPPHPCRTSLLLPSPFTACGFRLSFRLEFLLFPTKAYTMLLPLLRRQPSDQHTRSLSDFVPQAGKPSV